MSVGANVTVCVCPYYLDAPGHVTFQSFAEPDLWFWAGQKGWSRKNEVKAKKQNSKAVLHSGYTF